MKKTPKTSWRQTVRAWLERVAAIGNHDFCPWANRYVYWLKQPIGWFLVAAAAAGLVGAFVAPQGWYVAGFVLLVLGLGVAWPWLAMRGLTAEIFFERQRCPEQQPVGMGLTITSRWPWPVWGLLVEEGFLDPNKQGERPATMALAQVTGWSRSHFQFTFTPPARGVYPHAVPMLATGFPFGIWMSKRPIKVRGELIVWPRCVDLKSLPLSAGARLSAVGSFVDRAGHDGDILSARPYREGDFPRRIHWAHTARRDTLIVCDRQTASRRHVLIVLDSRAFEDHRLDGTEPLAWALRVVASLSRELHDHACELACELNGELLPVAPTVPALHRLFDRLARFEPAAAARRGIEPRGSEVAGRLTILVTTLAGWSRWQAAGGRSERGSVRAVVLHSGWLGVGEQGPPPFEAPWLRIDLASDPALQLQRQWERQCHDDWCVH